MLSVDFVEQVSEKGLPWHIAIKKIPYCADSGETIKPDNTNGVKFETFVFDALPMSKKSVTMEVIREDEFAPVKNASGIDSAESSRQLLSNYAARMLNQAGIAIPLNDNGDTLSKIEMSYLYAMDVDDLMGKIDPNMKVDGDLLLE
jgi:UDP-N-acetylglucosamine/UDP-N-acetylgalactosamine diphosphorylase